MVKALCRKLGYPREAVRRLAIAMYEGEINMVVHAGGGEATVEFAAHEVSIVLQDQGPGIADIDKAMEEGYSTASREIRQMGFGAGMGLPNMKRYSDEFSIESSAETGTTVRIRISMKPGEKSGE